MVFRRLRKRGRDRARSSERRRLGKAFQKDGPTTAKLLRWAVASLTLGTTRSPCSAFMHHALHVLEAPAAVYLLRGSSCVKASKEKTIRQNVSLLTCIVLFQYPKHFL